jgi:hypothetical protein
MKKICYVVVILLIGLFAVACQKTTAGGGSAATEAPVGGNPYPASDQPAVEPAAGYPAPTGAPQASLPVTLYPELKDGDILEWQHVEGTIYSGLVSAVSQKHDLSVTIKMKDGRTFVTTEPAIDDIVKLVQLCGDLCKDIRIATE